MRLNVKRLSNNLNRTVSMLTALIVHISFIEAEKEKGKRGENQERKKIRKM